ncbi:MAG: hypothetical protein IIV58_06630 [Alistipes sp.]|nr:hypothetical protein [Alistipes sp.]
MKKNVFLLGIALSLLILGCEKNNENGSIIPPYNGENVENGEGNNIPGNGEDDPSYNDWLVDYNPIQFVIMVCDAEGNDLLNSSTPNALSLADIKMLYNGEIYTLNNEEVATRAYMPTFYGLKLVGSEVRRELWIGEFAGDEFFDNIDITIDWGDGTSNTITLYNKIVAPFDGETHIDRRFYLDGEQIESSKILFTR